MPSEQKTPLGLSQWQGRDRPKREDFNTDNQLIDYACRTVITGLTEHLEEGAHPSGQQLQKWDRAAEHPAEGIASAAGLHGLRYYGGQLEVNVGGVWQACTTGGGPGVSYKVYGVCVDTASTAPDAVAYTDDAVGMEPCGGQWDDTFFGLIRPCLMKNGKVACYLHKDNYGTDEKDNPVDIYTGDAGDVMVEIPKLAYAVYYEGTNLYVKVTDHPEARKLDSRFCYLAHTRDQEGDRQKLYVSAYLGSVLGGRLRSLSGKTPVGYRTPEDYRQLAGENGAGYSLLSYYPLVLLQCLILIRGGTRNSQAAFGRGYTYMLTEAPTGATDNKGMYFGEAEGRLQMKALGIEDLWGNMLYCIDGLRTDDAGYWMTATGNFGREESWTRCEGQAVEQIDTAYIGQVWGGNHMAFLIKAAGGGTNAGWCDTGARFAGCVTAAGGYYYDRQTTGMFAVSTQYGYDYSRAYFGARLMYL